MKKLIGLILFPTLMFSTLVSAESKNAEDKSAAPKSVSLPSVIKEGEYVLFDGEKYQSYAFFEHDSLLLSPDCRPADRPTCQAFKAASAAKPVESKEFNGNPASQLCSDLKGKNLIGFNHKKQEFNFCQFEDKSMVNSWNLYYKFFPKK